ncbi:Hypothetical_protein [Hexamita inflata]|uniref:Hypothetical_protein n=1 Tax=Hexamita inflata TaxID=28002 RepID=A0AA86QQN5_9EUKA|nr:Hypothetical protein HINF_LOCUS51846 [Hexamita inflata]
MQSTQVFSKNNRFFMTIQRYHAPNIATVAAPASALIPEVAVVMVQRPDVVSRQRSKFPIALKQNVILKYHLFQKILIEPERQLQSTFSKHFCPKRVKYCLRTQTLSTDLKFELANGLFALN